MISAILFGIWPNASRAIYADGGNWAFTMLVSVWVRGLLLGLFCLCRRIPLFDTPAARRQALKGGIGQAIAAVSLYLALLYLPGPIVILILFTHTLMLLLYSAWRGQLRLDGATVATTLMALAGLTFVLDIWGAHPTMVWAGYTCAFVAALATAGRLYVYGQQTATRHPIAIGAENFLVASFLISCLMPFWPPVMPLTAMGWTYTAIALATLTIGSFGMFYGIAILGAFQWSLFLKLEPIFTAIFAVLLLGETLQAAQYAGMTLVIGSLVAYQLMQRRSKLKILPE